MQSGIILHTVTSKRYRQSIVATRFLRRKASTIIRAVFSGLSLIHILTSMLKKKPSYVWTGSFDLGVSGSLSTSESYEYYLNLYRVKMCIRDRIRVSRDLRGSREADPMEETVKIPLLSPGVKRGRRSDLSLIHI